jgi:hypothetical protein
VDAFGNVEPALTVVFGVGSGEGGATFSTVTYQGNGIYLSTLLATTSGSNTIIASIAGQTVTSLAPAITVTPGPVSLSRSTLSLTTASMQAGLSTTITLTALDAYGNQETGDGLIVAFGLGAGSTGGTISGVTDNGNGTYTATFSASTAGNNTITATIGGQTVTSQSPTVTVTPGPVSLSQTSVSIGNGNLQAGQTTTITLTAVDAFGNAEPGLAVVFGVGSGKGSATFSNVTYQGNGVYSATVTGTTAGSNTITTIIAGQAITSTAPSITVTTGPVSLAQSSVTLSAASLIAGSSITVTLTARDAYGNQETTGGLAVTFGVNGNGNFLNYSDHGNGTYTMQFSATTAATLAVSATISGQQVTSTPPLVTVTPAAAQSLVLSGFAASAVLGVAQNVTVTALDAFGNVATGYIGAVHFQCSDLSALLPANYTFVASDAGVHVFTNGLTLNTLGTQSLQASDVSGSAIGAAESSLTAGYAAPLVAGSGTAANASIGITLLNNALPAADYTATINWGDRTPANNGTVSVSGTHLTVSGNHTFQSGSAFVVNVSVTDSTGDTFKYNTTAFVGTPSQRFVEELYLDLFNRVPDSGGLSNWSAAIDSGEFTQAQIVEQLTVTNEFRTDVVESLYHSVLRRAADPTGLAAWVNFLNNGKTAEQLEAQLLGSAEFFNNEGGGSFAGFLNALYSVVLHRPVDQSGLGAWSLQLAAGMPRTQVAAAILASPESDTDQVQVAFEQFFRRPPSAVEASRYGTDLEAGMPLVSVITDLIGTQEYAARVSGAVNPTADPNELFVQQIYLDLEHSAANTAGLQFVTALDTGSLTVSQVVQTFLGGPGYQNAVIQALYEKYLGRLDDPSGLLTWGQALASGQTDEFVASQIAGSQEYYDNHGDTPQGFVETLFQDALGRLPSQAELQAGVASVLTGTIASRVALAASVFSSQEYQADLINSWYLQYLRRPSDSGGFANALAALQHGTRDETIIAALVGSSEYFSRIQRTNA